MNYNPESDHSKNIQVLQQLLHNEEDAQILKNDLIELLANYSRQLIQHYASQTGNTICPNGEPDRQLYSLMQVIAVLDAESSNPLFGDAYPDFLTGESY